MGAVRISENIWWVGAVDWEIRDFHGLSTHEGSSYNSYLVVDDKVALIDAVRADKAETLRRHIAEVVDPAKIDYIISNHSEPDHSGALGDVMAWAPNARLLASKEGVKRLEDMFHQGWKTEAVGEDDEISLGKVNLRFLNTPLIHWPETMMSYCPEQKVLFSCDGFGAHMATTERFVDELDQERVFRQTRKYFAYLLAAYRSAIQKAMKKIEPLELDAIGPSHGPVWRGGGIKTLFGEVNRWAGLELEDRATIVYGSMWGGTAKMAAAVAEGLQAGGLETVAYNIQKSDPSDILSDSFLSRVVLLASPTFESGIFPPVEGFIPFLRIPRDKSKKLAVFGSFGWSGGSTRKLTDILTSEGYQVHAEPLTLKFFPGEDGIAQCLEFGRRVAEWSRQEPAKEVRSAAK
jgi:flavorubredoxin